MPYFRHDTIAQIATPPGHGTTGVVRISGPEAFSTLASCLAKPVAFMRGFTALRLRLPLSVYGPTGWEKQIHICPAHCLIMPAPATYTREDVAELLLPGAPALLRAAMEALAEAGARPAEAGEFTFRAFRNGRLDLSQAEAVEEVVMASGAAERRAALARLGDGDAAKIRLWRDRALDMAARLEAVLDFSDTEPDIDAAADIERLAVELTRQGLELRDAADAGAPSPDLPQAALVGLANAGKSSLYNALLGQDEALVSPQASTTRDSLHRLVEWEGVRLALSDNPGYHPGGVVGGGAAAARAWRGLGGEDVPVWVMDASRPFGPEEEAFARSLPAGVVLALNKSDLPAVLSVERVREAVTVREVIATSARTGQGLGELRRSLASLARTGVRHSVWNRREEAELTRALGHCRAAAAELSGPGRWELASEELRQAVTAFSLAMGEGYAEETLGRIFSTFCIGK